MVAGVKMPDIGRGFSISSDFRELSLCGPYGLFFRKIKLVFLYSDSCMYVLYCPFVETKIFGPFGLQKD